MSIGPSPKKEDFKTSLTRRVTTSIKKNAEEFFKQPLYYLFYTMLAATIVGLFFNKEFSWQYYLILILLGGWELKKILKL